MRVVLEVIESENAKLVGQRFVFDRHQAFVVGRKRNERVQFRIPEDPYFSRYHLMVEVNPPHCYIRDLGSRNGTKVNGQKVDEARLKDGDEIEGGRTKMRVRIETEPVAPIPKPPPVNQVGDETGDRWKTAVEPRAGRPVLHQVADETGDRWKAAAEARAGRPVLHQVGDETGDRWKTLALGRRPGAKRGEVRCTVCKQLAQDSVMGDLTDTSLIAFVCEGCRGPQSDPQHPVPNYETLAKLGSGTLGPVYKARRLSSGKLVALKVLAPELSESAEAVKLFLRQMVLASQLKHPNIVPIVEMGQAGKQLWLASEYIDGPDARKLRHQWIKVLSTSARGPGEARADRRTIAAFLPDAVEIVCQTLAALDYAHSLNLVHRDVKPSNILVTGQPGSYTARLADFGLIRNMDEAGMSQITREGEARGTVPFMPPEQVMDCRFVKPQGDIYGAGATLYWLLTGEFVRDFEAQDARGETKDPYIVILEDKIIPLRQRDSTVPAAVASVVEQALADDPEDRYATAAEMAAALRRALG